MAVLGAFFVGGGWQAILINIGTALLLIPPIVVTERLVLSEDVKESNEQLLRDVATLRTGYAQDHARLMHLFSEETGFLATEALDLFKEASRQGEFLSGE